MSMSMFIPYSHRATPQLFS